MKWKSVLAFMALLMAGVALAQAPPAPHLRGMKPVPVPNASVRLATHLQPQQQAQQPANVQVASTRGIPAQFAGHHHGSGCATCNSAPVAESAGCSSGDCGLSGSCCPDAVPKRALGLWNNYCAGSLRGCGCGALRGGCCQKVPIGMYGATPYGCCLAGVGFGNCGSKGSCFGGSRGCSSSGCGLNFGLQGCRVGGCGFGSSCRMNSSCGMSSCGTSSCGSCLGGGKLFAGSCQTFGWRWGFGSSACAAPACGSEAGGCSSCSAQPAYTSAPVAPNQVYTSPTPSYSHPESVIENSTLPDMDVAPALESPQPPAASESLPTPKAKPTPAPVIPPPAPPAPMPMKSARILPKLFPASF